MIREKTTFSICLIICFSSLLTSYIDDFSKWSEEFALYVWLDGSLSFYVHLVVHNLTEKLDHWVSNFTTAVVFGLFGACSAEIVTPVCCHAAWLKAELDKWNFSALNGHHEGRLATPSARIEHMLQVSLEQPINYIYEDVVAAMATKLVNETATIVCGHFKVSATFDQ